MGEDEQVKQRLIQELQWVRYRNEMLDNIENKLLQMRAITQRAQNETLDEKEKEDLNKKFRCLASQVQVHDRESKKYEFII